MIEEPGGGGRLKTIKIRSFLEVMHESKPR